MTGLLVKSQAKEITMVIEPSQRCGCGDPNSHSGIPNGCPKPGPLDPRDRRVLYWHRNPLRRIWFALKTIRS
jgi:hypothetical protein